MFKIKESKMFKSVDKTKPTPCKCDAYLFPHRLDGGDCRALYNEAYNSKENRYERYVDDMIKARKEEH